MGGNLLRITMIKLGFLPLYHSCCLIGRASASHEWAPRPREAPATGRASQAALSRPWLSVHRHRVWPSPWHPCVSSRNSSELSQAGSQLPPSADLPWEGDFSRSYSGRGGLRSSRASQAKGPVSSALAATKLGPYECTGSMTQAPMGSGAGI